MKKSTCISAANLATQTLFLAALQDATRVVGEGRIYPIFRFQAVDDQSEALVKSTSGYGDVDVTREGNYNMIFEMASGGMCLQYQLRKFNFQNGGWAAMFVDDKNQIMGRKATNGDLYGFDLSLFHAHPLKFNNGSDPTKYLLEIGMSNPAQLNDSFGIVPCTFDVETEVQGLLNVELVQLAVVAGTATIGLRLQCGQTDLYDDLSTLMSDASLWNATDSTGAAVVITDADANATLRGWDVDTAATGAITFKLAPPATLATANIGKAPDNGYDSIPLTITMPGL